MLDHRFVHQPAASNHAEALAEMLGHSELTNLDMAVAYVSDSGVSSLLEVLASHTSAKTSWANLNKRFLVGVDWFRSQPTALDRLDAIPKAKVRIYDGRRVVAKPGCIPRVSWHPKGAFAYGQGARAAVHGSGNLSRNGLEAGVELGSLQVVLRPSNATERLLWDSLGTNQSWFEQMWSSATPLSSVRSEYATRYAAEAVKGAAPTEDDADPGDVTGTNRRGLTPEQIRAMRVASSLWIEAGNITKNRGPVLPGDQLMMSAMMRVFFGFDTLRVPVDTTLGTVAIRHPASGTVEHRSLRYSNNQMDVLTLPVPGTPPWPTRYDQTCLLFTKVTDGQDLQFELRTGTGNAKRSWRSKSRQVGSAYAMSSGREWGVF